MTFHEQLARGTAEEHFEAASKRFTETFGAPAVQDDNGTGTQYLEWQDKKQWHGAGAYIFRSRHDRSDLDDLRL